MMRIGVKVKVLLLSCSPCTNFRAVMEEAVSSGHDNTVKTSS